MRSGRPGDNPDRKKAMDATRSRNDRMGALASIAARIGVYRDTRRLAREAMQAIADLLPVKSAILLLTDRKSQTLGFHEAFNLPSEEVERFYRLRSWSDCLEGEVVARREPILIEDVSTEARAVHYPEGAMSLGMIPLMSRDRAIGVLSVTTAKPHRLDEFDMEFLLTLGSQLGIYLENARLMEELEETNKQLLRQNQDLEELLSVISHDLRSPLATIGGYASLLMKKGDRLESEERVQFAETIFRKTRETSRRFDDLLAVFRSAMAREGEEPSEVDVAAVIEEALEEADPDRYRETFTVEIPEELPRLLGYSTHLVHVFTNLFSNAFKFSSSVTDPRISVTYEPDETSGERVHRFSVTDNGPGIPEDYLAEIFRPFTRVPTDVEVEGSGVGLASVQRIIRSHGGAVDVESEVGRGTTVSFTLPWEEA